jgi:hypothetical protein
MEKNRPGSGQLFGHHGVQDRARDAALHDEAAETGRFRELLVVMEGVCDPPKGP